MRWLPPPGAVALGTLSQPLVPTSVADRPTDRVRLRAAGEASLLQLRSPRSPADTFAPRPAPPAPLPSSGHAPRGPVGDPQHFLGGWSFTAPSGNRIWPERE